MEDLLWALSLTVSRNLTMKLNADKKFGRSHKDLPSSLEQFYYDSHMVFLIIWTLVIMKCHQAHYSEQNICILKFNKSKSKPVSSKH